MGYFGTTHWSVVLAVGDAEPTRAAAALKELCETYWYPLYAFARQSGDSVEDAKDSTQAFFQHLIEKRLAEQARPERGRFRSFLLTSFRNFRAAEKRRANAAKRGGGATTLSIDALAAEKRLAQLPTDRSDPEKEFERNWALEVLDRSFTALEQEYTGAHKAALFTQLRPFLMGAPSDPYPALAGKLGKTEQAVKQEVYRMRRRYREHLRSIVGHTVTESGEIDHELSYLLKVLAE